MSAPVVASALTGGLQPVGRFSAPEVAAAAEVSYRVLDYWCRNGLIQRGVAAPGTGFQRSFSFDDALDALILASVQRVGVPASLVPLEQVRATDWFGSGPVRVAVDVRWLRSFLAATLGVELEEVSGVRSGG